MSQFYFPNTAYYSEFTTANPTTGAAQDADSTPAATATKNGADDAGFSLTVAKLATGRYKVTGTVPAGYAAGDRVQISVTATVASTAGVAAIDSFHVVSSHRGCGGDALPDAAAGSAAGLENAIAAALLDLADGIETGMTLRQALRVMAAVMAGKISGAGSGTETFKGIDGSTTRVVVSTDAAGNRLDVNYSPS